MMCNWEFPPTPKRMPLLTPFPIKICSRVRAVDVNYTVPGGGKWIKFCIIYFLLSRLHPLPPHSLFQRAGLWTGAALHSLPYSWVGWTKKHILSFVPYRLFGSLSLCLPYFLCGKGWAWSDQWQSNRKRADLSMAANGPAVNWCIAGRGWGETNQKKKTLSQSLRFVIAAPLRWISFAHNDAMCTGD